MKYVDLRIAENDWSVLTRHFARSFRGPQSPETGAIAILGECKTPAKHEFVVSKVLMPGAGDLKRASSGEVVFDASYIRRAHLEMRKEGLAGIATFHTHPFADQQVAFSPYDNRLGPLACRESIRTGAQDAPGQRRGRKTVAVLRLFSGHGTPAGSET